MSAAQARAKLLQLREEAIVRDLRERPPPQFVAIDAALASLDEVPADAKHASRAVVSDDGKVIRLILYAETGVVASGNSIRSTRSRSSES